MYVQRLVLSSKNVALFKNEEFTMYIVKCRRCRNSLQGFYWNIVIFYRLLKSAQAIFLKNFNVFAKLLGLETVEDVLQVDDSPQKNLLNNVHSVVHFQN